MADPKKILYTIRTATGEQRQDASRRFGYIINITVKLRDNMRGGGIFFVVGDENLCRNN